MKSINKNDKIYCPKCFTNKFYAESNLADELILRCCKCNNTFNMHIQPAEEPLIKGELHKPKK